MSELVPTLSNDPPKLRGGPTPERFQLERITNPEIIADLLYKTQELSDDAFYDLVDDIGYRAARLVLRHHAINGNIKAIELYDKVVLRDRRAREERARPAPRNATVDVAFGPELRTEPAADTSADDTDV